MPATPLRYAQVLRTITVSLSLLLVLKAALPGAEQQAPAGGGWEATKIPEAWKKARGGVYRAREGYAWFRCAVDVPESWQGQDLQLFVEAVDDARQIYFNGVKVGAVGEFPPVFRSGLGSQARLLIDRRIVRCGQPNLVAIRVYFNYGRSNFNVAAPVLFGGDKAVRLQGDWQSRSGDDLNWSKPTELAAVTTPHFKKLDDAAAVNRTLQRLQGDVGPLTTGESLSRMQVFDDLVVELPLAEPHVRQPLSMKFDARGRLWVVQYLQYPTPAGLTMVSRDTYLRSVYDKVPLPPPHHFVGADKITIHTDSDGDGTFDQHRSFLEGLSLVTSFALGRGGVWVLNPPYLLFYPDKDADDVPDGDPEVHLQGFGLEDSHSIANSLRWGPDGWLYACQGSTVTGNIKRPGSPEKPLFTMGQLIWRYHPESRQYEVFAEGGGNAFGLEVDSKGRIYSGHNGGDTRGFHYVQGGYFRKGFAKHGELSNPYAFGYFNAMKHNKAPRFTHTFVIYEGASLPATYRGKLFGVAPLHSHVVHSLFEPNGSTFQTRDLGFALESKDAWFRPVDVQVGPDGAIYVADMYEQRIDHASHYQGRIHRESGRIYRLRAKGGERPAAFDLGRRTTAELIETLRHPDKWFRQTALRLLGDRRDPSAVAQLEQLLDKETGQLALEALWALNLSGGLNEASAARLLQHDDPFVRLWTVRLVCDARRVAPAIAQRLVRLAETELNVETRSQLACSARRLPAEQSLPIVDRLLRRTEDAADAHLPLLLWWTLEDKAEKNRRQVVDLFRDATLWGEPTVQQHILSRLMRRYAQAGTRRDLLTCAELLNLAPSQAAAEQLLAGFEEAYEGRALGSLPAELLDALAKQGGGSLALKVQQADPQAIEEALAVVRNEKADRKQRLQLIQVFAAIDRDACVSVLLPLVARSTHEELRRAALTTLQAYDDPAIGSQLVALHDKLPGGLREVCQSVLASRGGWALALLQAVDEGGADKEAVSSDMVRKMMLHDDPRLAALVRKHWGPLQGATTDQMRAEIQRLSGLLASGSGNPYKGKVLFAQQCGKCHVLFGQGGRVGPGSTSYKRDDLNHMLANVVNPSLEIREGFENFVVLTDDGRALNGFIADQDNRVVELRGVDGATVVVQRDQIEEMNAIRRSIMPEGLLKPLDEQQLRDLFAYMRATQPLP